MGASVNQAEANKGFHDVVIYKHGVQIVVPKQHLKKDGTLEEQIVARLNELTRENIKFLAYKNVQVFVAK